MEYIKKEDLIEGEIYKSTLYGDVFKYLDKNGDNNPNINTLFHKNGARIGSGLNNIINATPEEKHWLNEAIKLDKFITFEEAMKTFIPEYVECIRSSVNGFTENKIYKIEKNWNDSINFQLIDDNSSNRTVIMTGGLWQFKPSTKEAYDAQFITEKPLPQFKVIETIETITKVENNEGNQFFIGDVVKSSNGTIQTIESFDYNKAKTNIIAFTNKQSILGNGIGIDKIEHYIESKVKDEFILPKKWFIKTTEETFDVIKNWAIIKSKLDYVNYQHHDYVTFNYEGDYRQNRNCTEITFEQFKKYVLK